MTEDSRCPQCHAALPKDAPEGLCPKCLMGMIQGDNSASTFDDHPVFEGPGSQIGNYELLELVGEGGMGLVYLAEQKEPVKRKVAIKIVKFGMDTKKVIARFEAERQTLALLAHPNIAYSSTTGPIGWPP